MNAIEYMNTISSNSYSDWIRCHNDMLHSTPEALQKVEDQSIRTISHLLKLLINEKVSNSIKYCVLMSVEENIEYFLDSINGAVTFFQSLINDFVTRISSNKYEYKYLNHVLTVLTNIAIHFDLPLEEISNCRLLIERYIDLLMELASKCELTIGCVSLKHAALCSLLHLEDTYPTLLLSQKENIFNLLNNETSVMYDLVLQLYSCVFKNCILDNCRIQNSTSKSKEEEESNTYRIERMKNFFEWVNSDMEKHYIQKYPGSQLDLFKNLQSIIDLATQYLSTCGIRTVILNCLKIVNRMVINNPQIWTKFLNKFIRSVDLNILEVLFQMKISKTVVLPSHELQETLSAVMHNIKIILQKRLLASYWLRDYPIIKRSDLFTPSKTTILSSSNIDVSIPPGGGVGLGDSISCSMEPQIFHLLYLRSFDTLEIKYNKLLLFNRYLNISQNSDPTSVLMFSSLKDLIKTVQYYDSGISFNILFRVMFAIHVTHSNSVIVRDFENILESLAVKYTDNLIGVIAYLNGLERRLGANQTDGDGVVCYYSNTSNDEVDRTRNRFSSKCMAQIAELSRERLVNLGRPSMAAFMMHLRVLTCAMKLCEDIQLEQYLLDLLEMLVTIKMDLNVEWLEKGYAEVLKFCYDLIRLFGCSNYYHELTSIFYEIQSECKDVRGKFLYVLLASLPSKKVQDIIENVEFEEIGEETFDIIVNKFMEQKLDRDFFQLKPIEEVKLLNPGTFVLDSNYELHEYIDFINNNDWKVKLLCRLSLCETCGYKEEGGPLMLAAVVIDFQVDTDDCIIDSWQCPLLEVETDMNVETELHLSISYPRSFKFAGKMSATKLDGMFIFYKIMIQSIQVIDICLPINIDQSKLTNQQQSYQFIMSLIDTKLNHTTFISKNFEILKRYDKFRKMMKKFYFSTMKSENGDEDIYLILLPSKYQLVLIDRCLSGQLYRRLDMYSDVDYDCVVELEDYFRAFN